MAPVKPLKSGGTSLGNRPESSPVAEGPVYSKCSIPISQRERELVTECSGPLDPGVSIS